MGTVQVEDQLFIVPGGKGVVGRIVQAPNESGSMGAVGGRCDGF